MIYLLSLDSLSFFYVPWPQAEARGQRNIVASGEFPFVSKHIRGCIHGTVVARWTTGQQVERAIVRQGHYS